MEDLAQKLLKGVNDGGENGKMLQRIEEKGLDYLRSLGFPGLANGSGGVTNKIGGDVGGSRKSAVAVLEGTQDFDPSEGSGSNGNAYEETYLGTPQESVA